MAKTRNPKSKKKSLEVKKLHSNNADKKKTDFNNDIDNVIENENEVDSFHLRPVSVLISRHDVSNCNNNSTNEDESPKSKEEISLKRSSRKVNMKADPVIRKKNSYNRRSKSNAKINYVDEEIEESEEEDQHIEKINDQKNVKKSVPPPKTLHEKNLPKNIENDESSSDEPSDTEYEVQRILEMKISQNGKREFLIRWKGYKANDDTWEKEEHLNCHELLEQFLEKNKNFTPKELRQNRPSTKRLGLEIDRLKSRTSERNRKEINYQEDYLEECYP